MKIAICDDNITINKLLQNDIVDFFSYSHIDEPIISRFYDGESLLASNTIFDIIFLDIEMPGLNGITVGNRLKELNKNTIIIIVTSFSEYLDDAMRFHVFRYLSKPIDKQRLFRNLKDAVALYQSLSATIAIEEKDSSHIVSTNDIIFVECMNKKVMIHTNDKIFLSIKTMDFWENILPKNCFFRTHRSFIVNMNYVSDYDHQLISFRNYNNHKAYMARRNYSKFKNSFFSYLEFNR